MLTKLVPPSAGSKVSVSGSIFLATQFLTKSQPRLLPVGSGLALVEALAARAEALGVTFFYETTRRHKKLTDWGRQVVLQAARWLPKRDIVAVANSSSAAIDLLNAVRRLCMITRLRLDARRFDPSPRRRPRTIGRPPVIGQRQPTLAKRLVNPKTRWRRLQVTGR